VTALLAGLLLAGLGVGGGLMAADQDAAVEQMTKLNETALAAYSDGDGDKAKAQLQKAVALGKKSGLADHPIMARTYLHLGVIALEWSDDRKGATKMFETALKIHPGISVTESLASKSVKAAFEKAKENAPPAASRGAEGSEAETAAADAADGKRQAAEDKAAEKKRIEAEAKEKEAKDKDAKEQEKTARREKDTEREKEKLQRDLAQLKEGESKERDKLQSEKKERDAAIAELKQKLAQAEKEKVERDKQIVSGGDREKKERDAKEKLAQEKLANDKAQGELKQKVAQLEKEKTEGLAREKKEREAKEKLEHEKVERDKQLADLKQKLAQVEKDKGDKEKALADAALREKKEREAKEKLERDKQLAQEHDKERQAEEESEKKERERLARGPALPSRLPESLYCPVPEEAQPGQDLYLHCAAQPSLKVKTIAFYYRSSGLTHYNSLAMEPAKTGWHTAMIPGDKVTGKLLQYYVEARDGQQKMAASNGKPSSPNIMTLRSGAKAGSVSATAAKPTASGRRLKR
jgi:hypothetical protein